MLTKDYIFKRKAFCCIPRQRAFLYKKMSIEIDDIVILNKKCTIIL